MQYIDKVICWLSSGLMVPVMVAVIYFLVQAFRQLWDGSRQYVRRMKEIKILDAKLNGLTYTHIRSFAELTAHLEGPLPATINELIVRSGSEAHRNRLLADFHNNCERELDRCRTLSKTGPILGLMGTLIPMGPALGGLAAGDIATMSEQMQIAFNTTVLGLVIGTIGFLLLQTKQRWYTADQNRVEFVNDIIQTAYENKA
ncbi:MAG: MotA/TolQ/ExbB proton channel family protein [Chitinophaga sp.]|uniref:MotA/TolQ/ExbB proton channel family protein n=1 Tax=Chitinophaga sp. TaxID=1869181 RepID=UPI0025BF999A|nr:MotA/TolQ/ExbB proton channel family protein [Chitinophaga sp.]MBV8255997.1 MotA/TolQ/ExbB proton channel family protein [Chitinophaga sp.]